MPYTGWQMTESVGTITLDHERRRNAGGGRSTHQLGAPRVPRGVLWSRRLSQPCTPFGRQKCGS